MTLRMRTVLTVVLAVMIRGFAGCAAVVPRALRGLLPARVDLRDGVAVLLRPVRLVVVVL